MINIKTSIFILICFMAGCTNQLHQSGRLAQNFNSDWTFHKGDVTGGEQPNFDDSGWRKLDLPHDWSIEGPFSEEWASGTGYLPAGIGWYRKSFTLPQTASGRKVFVYFDGAYNNSEIWLNGSYLGKRPNGYISLQYDLTPHIKFGDKNVLAVKVDHTRFGDSRWYTGSGIYRDVKLITTSALHIKQWGVYAVAANVTSSAATLDIETSLLNESGTAGDVTVENQLLYDGKTFGTTSQQIQIAAVADTVVRQNLAIENPRLWDIDTPHLYSLETTVKQAGEVLDKQTTPIGFRDIRFDANAGFFLNGRNLKLKGICMHHDAGGLGAAVPKDVIARRLDLLKEMGCNAIRTSHNPFSSDFLDLCDSKGFVVIDEAFDEWEESKNKWIRGWNVGEPGRDGYADAFEEWARQDLADLVLRDRNRPSVIMWSIGNEVDYPNDPYTHPILNSEANPQTWAKFRKDLPHADRQGEVARELVAIIKQYDASRPVTAGLASALMSNETGYADALDVVGYNYQEFRYAADHQKYPNRVLYGSENGMALSAWQAVAENDYILGQFLWTGFEYMGEAGRFPKRHNTSGALDLAGNKKTEFYFRQSLWSDEPMVYIGTAPSDENEDSGNLWAHKVAEPHWNWQEGETVRVKAFSNCEAVELFVNDKSLGVQNMAASPGKVLQWDVPFAAGTVRAVATTGGVEKAVDELRTAGAATRLLAESDVTKLKANKQDVAHVFVTIVDDNGIPVYSAADKITCTISGPARLLCIEDSNPENIEDYKDNTQSAYSGKLLLYLQALDTSGTATVTVSAHGLQSAAVILNVDVP
ncbi:MAG TPA: glycoside hydrolase family 2 TIM barrel-domain containing protein [bacterium]